MIWTFGSINVDHVYRVPHLPGPGETLTATGLASGLGGKGANQSVAAARAGREVRHIGRVGSDRRVLEDMRRAGVDLSFVELVDGTTGHANIYVDPAGENQIVIVPGENRNQSLSHLENALGGARPGDILLLQNEVNHAGKAARIAKDRGCFVIYSAAPFVAEDAGAMVGLVDLLVVNEIEAAQMAKHLGIEIDAIEVANLLVTKGARGAEWLGEERHVQPAFEVTPVDTTGAGDCFIGYVAAALDGGFPIDVALLRGAAASALQVTRHGASAAMPTSDEVDAFLATR
ncbi:ribokinase [Maritimibacter sp. DP1N21-5]|uniref:ribokinase n=1 Tax=Maritimibacter sp. DP1N21-5 TaxID=2836867 RepID=UPI001C47F28C|nr:ribokinase [Maritimibacter sp. DP1N21-5]MBV7411004.1 ribokinase [Maritimibacter sp. DP1N21-5]